MKIRSIVPNLAYSQKNVLKIENGKLMKTFSKFIEAIPNKKLMSDILEIKETKDIYILYQAFMDQYKGLFLASKEEEMKLINQLKERIFIVLNNAKETSMVDDMFE